MSYSLKFNVDGIGFTVTADTVDELKEEYSQLGGDPKWFVTRMQEVVPEYQTGKFAFAATVAAAAEAVQDVPAPSRSAWDDDGPWSGRNDAEDQARKDPWDDAPVDEKPAARRSAPSRGTSRADHEPGRNEPYAKTDKFDRRWTMNLPDAPMCACGEPAARMQAISQAGKRYTKYRCAKGAPDGDWQDKCDFDEFPPK